jgi:hypothetical protein
MRFLALYVLFVALFIVVTYSRGTNDMSKDGNAASTPEGDPSSNQQDEKKKEKKHKKAKDDNASSSLATWSEILKTVNQLALDDISPCSDACLYVATFSEGVCTQATFKSSLGFCMCGNTPARSSQTYVLLSGVNVNCFADLPFDRPTRAFKGMTIRTVPRTRRSTTLPRRT